MPALLRRLAALFAMLGGAAACAVALMVAVSVAGRALAAKSVPGDVELTQFGVALSITLCLPWAQLTRSNIIIDFFTQGLAARAQRHLDAFGALLLALMTGVLAWRAGVGAAAVRAASETSMILGLPMWWTYAVLAPGLALTALIALVQAAHGSRGDAAAEPGGPGGGGAST